MLILGVDPDSKKNTAMEYQNEKNGYYIISIWDVV